VCELAVQSGARTHLRQLSTRGAIERARAARDQGADLTVEVNPHHLALTAADGERGGPRLKVVPPLRPASEVKAVRDAVCSGLVDLISSDHAPHTLEEKEVGRTDMWAAPAGFPGLETMLPVLLTTLGPECVERIVELCAAAPARRFGLASKGRVWPGFDADLVLVDPSEEWIVGTQDIESRAGFSVFEGRRLRGRVRHTFVRGRRALSNGVVVAESAGQLVPRTGLAGMR